jgi:hypothetical protein
MVKERLLLIHCRKKPPRSSSYTRRRWSDIRSRILCPVGPAPTLDEIEVIAQVALAKAHHPEEVLK